MFDNSWYFRFGYFWVCFFRRILNVLIARYCYTVTHASQFPFPRRHQCWLQFVLEPFVEAEDDGGGEDGLEECRCQALVQR